MGRDGSSPLPLARDARLTALDKREKGGSFFAVFIIIERDPETEDLSSEVDQWLNLIRFVFCV